MIELKADRDTAGEGGEEAMTKQAMMVEALSDE